MVRGIAADQRVIAAVAEHPVARRRMCGIRGEGLNEIVTVAAVTFIGRRVGTDDPVVAAVAIDGVTDGIVPGDRVVPVAGVDDVMARHLVDGVVAIAAKHRIVAGTGADVIIAVAAIEVVVATSTVDGIVSGATLDVVVAVAADQGVIAGITEDLVACGGVRGVSREGLDEVVAVAAMALVGRGVGTDDPVVALIAEDNITDLVVPRDQIVARTCVYDVVTGHLIDRIDAVTGEHDIVARSGADVVVSRSAFKKIVAVAAGDDVVARAAEDMIVTITAVERIITVIA
ncbi:hypothetical protein [Bradyrhizobium sp. Leo121]|uniref:hypothetical protein n=1 Tax=Bradyrhizobium sp. Leo121 TaxID=1571195 RepID=UPI001FE1422B|nr:hypothetical protein [Bradyrhizobium sp. Leo121]